MVGFLRIQERKLMDIPPPEKRPCRIHGKPIVPSRWRAGNRTTMCSTCCTGYHKGPKSKKRRSLRWDKEIICCTFHPGRRCNRSAYVYGGAKKCSSCCNRRSDGAVSPSTRRSYHKYGEKVRDRKRMARYAKNPTRRKSISEILRMRLGIR
jgi:hypothetical protein